MCLKIATTYTNAIFHCKLRAKSTQTRKARKHTYITQYLKAQIPQLKVHSSQIHMYIRMPDQNSIQEYFIILTNRTYATTPQQDKGTDKDKDKAKDKAKKIKKNRNKKKLSGEEQETEIEEAPENALSVADETKPPQVLKNLRHLHSGKNPIPSKHRGEGEEERERGEG
jgi:hypothetical protein